MILTHLLCQHVTDSDIQIWHIVLYRTNFNGWPCTKLIFCGNFHGHDDSLIHHTFKSAACRPHVYTRYRGQGMQPKHSVWSMGITCVNMAGYMQLTKLHVEMHQYSCGLINRRCRKGSEMFYVELFLLTQIYL